MGNARRGLTGNVLKIIAMVSMLVDHIGFYLFPTVTVLRAIGRIAFPIFAYMISEGYLHTRRRLRYFLTVLGVGLVCQVIATAADGRLYFNILITFALAIAACYLSDILLHSVSAVARALATAALVALALLSALPYLLPDFSLDYGAVGVFLPPLLYHIRGQKGKLLAMAAGLAALAIGAPAIQWCSFLAIPLLALYRGERGRAKLKYLFYLFYPAHHGALWLISEFCLP